MLFQIIHTDSNTILGQNDTGFSCDGSASTFRVMFKEPVEILPSVNYIACATLKVNAYLTHYPVFTVNYTTVQLSIMGKIQGNTTIV